MDFKDLRSANVTRCEEVFHKLHEWSPTDWATAMAGECGEACNLVKKLRRLDGADRKATMQEDLGQRMLLTAAIAAELADTVIYVDLLAARLGINLGEVVREKFNQVSEQRGSTVFL